MGPKERSVSVSSSRRRERCNGCHQRNHTGARIELQRRFLPDIQAGKQAPMRAGVDKVDILITPAFSHPSIEQVAAEPIAVNSELGKFTNYMNLLIWRLLYLVSTPKMVSRLGLLSRKSDGGWQVIDSLAIQRLLVGKGVTATEKGLFDRRRMEIVVCGALMEGCRLTINFLREAEC